MKQRFANHLIVGKFTVCILGGLLGLSTVAQAQLPPPPSGFSWVFQNNASYADNGTFSKSLDGTQSLAPSASPVVTSLAETLSLTSFDAAATEATLESDNPGMDYAIVVLSSTFSTSLSASTSTQIFNFDSTFAAHDYSGTTSASNFQISGAGTAGPTTNSLVNPAFNVAPFAIGDFADASSSSTSASISLTDSGTAPTNGSTLNFSYSGSAILALFSDDSSAANQFGVMTASSFGSAGTNANYAVYKLVADPVPEPSAALLVLSAALFGFRRKR